MSAHRARVNYEKTELYDTLVDEYGVFESYTDCFVFAAALGYARDEYVPDGDEGDNEILWMHLQGTDLYRVVVASITYQHTSDPESLVEPSRQLPIVARYAAGGVKIAAAEFGDISGDPTDAVVNFLRRTHDDDASADEEAILSQIQQGFDDSLFK